MLQCANEIKIREAPKWVKLGYILVKPPRKKELKTIFGPWYYPVHCTVFHEESEKNMKNFKKQY